jgi:hypothetical protein
VAVLSTFHSLLRLVSAGGGIILGESERGTVTGFQSRWPSFRPYLLTSLQGGCANPGTGCTKLYTGVRTVRVQYCPVLVQVLYSRCTVRVQYLRRERLMTE